MDEIEYNLIKSPFSKSDKCMIIKLCYIMYEKCTRYVSGLLKYPGLENSITEEKIALKRKLFYSLVAQQHLAPKIQRLAPDVKFTRASLVSEIQKVYISITN